jgi:hypothetical protein
MPAADIALDSANTTTLLFDPFPPNGLSIYPNNTKRKRSQVGGHGNSLA